MYDPPVILPCSNAVMKVFIFLFDGVFMTVGSVPIDFLYFQGEGIPQVIVCLWPHVNILRKRLFRSGSTEYCTPGTLVFI